MKNTYKVFDKDYMGDEPKYFTTHNAEEAAEEYAEYYNTQGDYALFDSEKEIEVENRAGFRTKFLISAEASVVYNARKVS